MSFVQARYYRILACCPENGSVTNINITGVYAGDGVYTYTGPDLPISGTAVVLKSGQCYQILDTLGSGPTITSIDATTLTLVGAGLGCNDPTLASPVCPDCGVTPGNYYIKAIPCCGGDPIFFKGEGYTGGTVTEITPVGSAESTAIIGGGALTPSIPAFSILDFNGVYIFNGFVNQLPGSIIGGLEIGKCYTFSSNSVSDPTSEITLPEYDLLPWPPYISQLGYVSKLDCDEIDPLTGRKYCPECEDICYRLTNCEGVIINTIIDLSLYVGTHISLVGYPAQTWFVQINEGICQDPTPSIKISATGLTGCPCVCYEVLGKTGISYIDCDGNSQSTYAPDKFCAQAPPVIEGISGEDYELIVGTDCSGGECIERCFLLTNCDPTSYPEQDAFITSNLQSLSQYSDTGATVELVGYEGCWEVTESLCRCVNVDIDGTIYEANAISTVFNGKKVFTLEVPNGTATELNYIWGGIAAGSWTISNAIGGGTNTIASIASSAATDCPIADSTIWVGGSLPDGTAVTALNTTLCPDQCDCPVAVTVIRHHKSCEDCLPTVAYKLTNCENSNEVTYTTQDLSAYIDKVLKDECACWKVEEIDYDPPSNVTIDSPILYTDCESCLATYYRLRDCDAVSPILDIITSTNLSAYIGQVIKVENCTQCFIVELYTDPSEPTNPADVTFVESFVDCIECGTVEPQCSTVFNTSVIDEVFSYIDVNGDTQVTDVVRSGETSLRYCVQRWIDPKQKGIFNYYGNCTVFEEKGLPKTAICSQYFPNDRKIRPGYNTAICSAEKYDRITCNFADILYKKALELRYGISNCCPEKDEKWLVQKELIELQALTDPNYKCDPLADCCGHPVSQCSCNS